MQKPNLLRCLSEYMRNGQNSFDATKCFKTTQKKFHQEMVKKETIKKKGNTHD